MKRQAAILLILSVVAFASPVLALQGGIGHTIFCGNHRIVYTDEPGTNYHTLYLAGDPSDAAMIATLEVLAGQDWHCKGCTPICMKSYSSTYATVVWTPLGSGFYDVETTELTITVHCADCN